MTSSMGTPKQVLTSLLATLQRLSNLTRTTDYFLPFPHQTGIDRSQVPLTAKAGKRSSSAMPEGATVPAAQAVSLDVCQPRHTSTFFARHSEDVNNNIWMREAQGHVSKVSHKLYLALCRTKYAPARGPPQAFTSQQ